jgi:hypothetical protein
MAVLGDPRIGINNLSLLARRGSSEMAEIVSV